MAPRPEIRALRGPRPEARGPHARILLGLALIYWGLVRMRGMGGPIVALAGILPIAMGLWGPCLVHIAVRRLRRA